MKEKVNYYDPMFGGTESYHILSPFDRNGVMKTTDSVVSFCKDKKRSGHLM